MSEVKINRLQRLGDHRLRVTFNDTSEVIIRVNKAIGVGETFDVQGTKVFRGEELLVDVAKHVDPGEAC